MGDVDQQRVVEDFGNAARPMSLLLCSDVASEGIDLSATATGSSTSTCTPAPVRSLMVFQPRYGRVDRYGQERAPRIVHLATERVTETIRGDTRILEVLERKDEQAYRNIGHPSAFMNVHDVHAEEEVTRRRRRGEGAERFDTRLAPAAPARAAIRGVGSDGSLQTRAGGTKPPRNRGGVRRVPGMDPGDEDHRARPWIEVVCAMTGAESTGRALVSLVRKTSDETMKIRPRHRVAAGALLGSSTETSTETARLGESPGRCS